jgi:hypothetical protein
MMVSPFPPSVKWRKTLKDPLFAKRTSFNSSNCDFVREATGILRWRVWFEEVGPSESERISMALSLT